MNLIIYLPVYGSDWSRDCPRCHPERSEGSSSSPLLFLRAQKQQKHFLVAEGDQNPKDRQESIHVEWQTAPGESHHATLTSPLHWRDEPAQS